MLTQREIKEMLDSGSIPIDQNNIIKQGSLTNCLGAAAPYDLYCGWDFVLARSCDRGWGAFNLSLMAFIEAKGYPNEELQKVLSELQLDDAHWDWLAKTAAYHSSEYVWFFLVAEGNPQGACLIYHPKRSAFAPDDIFYIEYVAVAPWNRKNPMAPRVFGGIGSMLIKHVIEYATTVLKLKHGFALHALSKAAPFYQKIGMTAFPEFDKPKLQYFEMLDAVAADYLEKK